MAIDYKDLGNKQDGVDGSNGRLTAKEWNGFVESVSKHESDISKVSNEIKKSVQGVRYNGQLFTSFADTSLTDGLTNILDITTDTTARDIQLKWYDSDGKETEGPTSVKAALGASIPVEFSVYDMKTVNMEPYPNKGTLKFLIDGKTVGLITGVSHGEKLYQFDFGKSGKNVITKDGVYQLSIVYENNGGSVTHDISCDIVSVTLSITPEMSDMYKSDSEAFPNARLSKNSTLNYKVIDSAGNVKTGTKTGQTISLSDIIKENSVHGINILEVYASQFIDTTEIKTDVKTYKYLYVDVNSQNPLIIVNIENNAKFDLYKAIDINYTVFVPNTISGDKDITVELLDKSGNVIENPKSQVVPTSISNGIGKGLCSFSLIPDDDKHKNELLNIGSVKVSFNNDQFSDTTNIEIVEVEVPYQQVEGAVVYFDADGYDNKTKSWESKGTENISMVFENVDFIEGSSGWVNTIDGNALRLRKDSYCTIPFKPFEKNPAFNSNGNSTGLTISIEFKVSNANRDNAEVISCFDKYGFIVTPSEAKLVSDKVTLKTGFTEDTRLRLDMVIEGWKTPYPYKTYGPIYENDDEENGKIIGQAFKEGTSEEALMLMYIDGVYSGIAEFGKTYGGMNISNKNEIRFGSDSCDIDIYKIRIYNRALDCKEIVDNFAFDANGYENKTSIALRNDIWDYDANNGNKQKINVAKLKTARENLPIFTVKLHQRYNSNGGFEEVENTAKTGFGELTNTKEIWQLLEKTEFYNKNKFAADSTAALASFQSNTGVIRNQGTSSMGYPWPWRNWDWKSGDTDFKPDGVTSDDYKDNYMLFYFPEIGENAATSTKFVQYPYKNTDGHKTAQMKKLTFKKDYASSEMCNNAICSELYTDFAYAIARNNNTYFNILSPLMQSEWNETNEVGAKKEYTDYRYSLKSTPCFMIQELSYDVDGDPSDIAGTAGDGKDALGMMNLIPNKNEVKYLGFSNNKWEDDDSDKREQSWECKDNLDSIFWKTRIDLPKIENGKIVSTITDYYEARTPKDSSIFDEKDFGKVDNSIVNEKNEYELLQKVIDEVQDITELHNWFVDTDRGNPSGKTLNEYYGEKGWLALQERYKEAYSNISGSSIDDVAFRELKFITEYEDYLIKEQWLLYYIWRELFWMYDSGFKNLQVYTLGHNPKNPTSPVMQWGCMVRDADTALGIENHGYEYFTPYLEDIDLYYSENNVIKYDFGAAEGVYDSSHIKPGRSAVLNGQFGSIWLNIRDFWKEDLEKVYAALKSQLPNVVKKFRSHQENWSEALYNFGMRQYFGGDEFLKWINAGLGDKKLSRAKWLERAIYYRNTKYNSWGDNYLATRMYPQGPLYAKNINDNKDPELWEEQNNIKLESYIPTYFGYNKPGQYEVNDGNVPGTKKRIVDVNNDKNYSINIDLKENQLIFGTPGQTSGDNFSILYGVEKMTDMDKMFKYVVFGDNIDLNADKLKYFEPGHEKLRDNIEYYTKNSNGEYIPIQNITNKVLNVNFNKLRSVEVVDLTNHLALTTLNGLDKCNQLKQLYLRGTSISSVNLPKTSTLNEIYLPTGMVDLKLIGLTKLNKLFVGNNNDATDYSKINRLEVVNCGYDEDINKTSYLSKESANIVAKCIDNLVSDYQKNGVQNCILNGINWQNSWGAQNGETGLKDYEILERLVDIDADLRGRIKVSFMPSSLKLKLNNKYGSDDKSIDDENNVLYVTYPTVEIKEVKFKRSSYWMEKDILSINMSENLKFIGNTAKDDPNTIISSNWTLEGADNIAKINSKTGVITRSTEDELNTPAKVTVVVKQKGNETGTIQETLTATVNIYFTRHDAKPGDIVYADGSFSSEYDAEANPIGICYYVSEDQSERMMFAWGYPTNIDLSWGLGTNTSSSNTTYNSYTDITGLNNEDVYNINGSIDDFKTFTDKFNSMTAGQYYFEDVYSTDGKTFAEQLNCAANGYLLEFVKSNEDVYVIEQIVDKNNKPEIKVISKDEKISTAYKKTVDIINVRNSVLLNNYDNFKNHIELTDIIPHTTNNSELRMLTDNITNINKAGIIGDPGSKGVDDKTANMDLYYPIASYCWAYKPEVVESNDSKFGIHKWALPTVADAARILYYIYNIGKDVDNDLTHNFIKFKDIEQIKKIENIVTSTESENGLYYKIGKNAYRRSAIASTLDNVNTYSKGRSETSGILPVCKF